MLAYITFKIKEEYTNKLPSHHASNHHFKFMGKVTKSFNAYVAVTLRNKLKIS